MSIKKSKFSARWVCVKRGRIHTEFHGSFVREGQIERFRIIHTQKRVENNRITESCELHRQVNNRFADSLSHQMITRQSSERPKMETLVEIAQERALDTLRHEAGELTSAETAVIHANQCKRL